MREEGVFGVHRFYSNERTDNAEDTAQILSAYIVQYLLDFGIEPDFFVEMTKAGPEEISILTKDELEEMGIVNNGIGRTTWSIEALPEQVNLLYLKGERQTQYGINKFIVFCSPDKELLLHVIFDPQGRQEQVMLMRAQSLSIDGQTIPFTKHLIKGPKIANGWLNATYLLPVSIIDKLTTAETVGVTFQFSYEAPVFLGFQGMEFDSGRQLFRGLRASCTN